MENPSGGKILKIFTLCVVFFACVIWNSATADVALFLTYFLVQSTILPYDYLSIVIVTLHSKFVFWLQVNYIVRSSVPEDKDKVMDLAGNWFTIRSMWYKIGTIMKYL